MGNFPFGIGAQ